MTVNLKNPQLLFQRVLSWSYHMNGSAFVVAGYCLCNTGKNIYYFFILSISLITTVFTQLLNPTLNYKLGSLKKDPGYYKDETDNSDCIIISNINIPKNEWDSYETSWDFKQYTLM